MWKQGINYIFSVFLSDPLTVFAIFIALFVTVLRRDLRNLMTGISLLVAVCYVISTGGDFMGGRFMSAPFLVAVLLVALGAPASVPAIPSKQPRQKKAGNISHGQGIPLVRRYRVHTAVAALIIYTIVIPLSPVKTPLQSKHLGNEQYGAQVFALPNSLRNIYQNTNYYYSSNPLFYSKNGFPFGNLIFHLLKDCRHCRQLMEESVIAFIGGGGVNGFCRGPLQQLIDPQAITDPLLARLPLPDLTGGFIPGHFLRTVPDGLLESYIANRNMVKDPKLREYYEKLFTVVRGPIFSLIRLKYIIELNMPWNRRYTKPYS